MFIHEHGTIISVKGMLEKRYRVPPFRQVLLWEGRVLGDGKYEGEKIPCHLCCCTLLNPILR